MDVLKRTAVESIDVFDIGEPNALAALLLLLLLLLLMLLLLLLLLLMLLLLLLLLLFSFCRSVPPEFLRSLFQEKQQV